MTLPLGGQLENGAYLLDPFKSVHTDAPRASITAKECCRESGTLFRNADGLTHQVPPSA